jgi:beta-lactamase regulating signal transducer with metallopeptidase domain
MVLVLLAPVLPASRWSVQNRFTRESAAVQAASRLVEASLPAGLKSAAGCAHLAMISLPGQPMLWAAWLLGTTVTLGVACAGYRRAWQRIHWGVRPTDPAVAKAVSDGAAQVGLAYLPRVIVSDGVDSPAVAGLFRPVLLLPAGFPGALTPVQMRLILRHELTHLRRFDLPLNWLLCALQALHWFNPLLWHAFSRIRSDREAACDAQVLSGEGLDRRADYGHALLKLASGVPRSRLDLAFGGAFGRAGLRLRLLAITRHRRNHPAWSAVSIAMIAALVLVGATRASLENAETPLAMSHDGAGTLSLGFVRIPWSPAKACLESADTQVLPSWSTTALADLAREITQDWLSENDHLPGVGCLLSGWRIKSL